MNAQVTGFNNNDYYLLVHLHSIVHKKTRLTVLSVGERISVISCGQQTDRQRTPVGTRRREAAADIARLVLHDEMRHLITDTWFSSDH